MGNNLKPNFIQQGQFLRIASRFQIIKYDTDRHCLQVIERKTQHQYIFKQINIKSIQEKQQYEHLSQEKQQEKIDNRQRQERRGKDNLLRLAMFGFEKDRLASNRAGIYKGYFLFEKPYKDLRTELMMRIELKEAFSDSELIIVVQGVVRTLKFLNGLGHSHGAVCTSNILISKEGIILLSDPWLNPEVNRYYRHKNRVYFSPERLEQQEKTKQKNKDKRTLDIWKEEKRYDWYTSDLFSLGVSVLELIFGESMEELYSSNQTIDFKELNYKITLIKNLKLKRYVYCLTHLTAKKRAQIGDQIDRDFEAKVVSVTLSDTNYKNSLHHDEKLAENQEKFPIKLLPFARYSSKKSFKLFENISSIKGKQKIKQQRQPKLNRSNTSVFKLIRQSSQQFRPAQSNFRKYRPSSFLFSPSISTPSKRTLSKPTSQFTPIKQYSTITIDNYSHLSHNKSPLSQLYRNNYSTHSHSHTHSQQKYPHKNEKHKIIYVTNENKDKMGMRKRKESGGMLGRLKKCKTQRNENIFQKQVRTTNFYQQCKTQYYDDAPITHYITQKAQKIFSKKSCKSKNPFFMCQFPIEQHRYLQQLKSPSIEFYEQQFKKQRIRIVEQKTTPRGLIKELKQLKEIQQRRQLQDVTVTVMDKGNKNSINTNWSKSIEKRKDIEIKSKENQKNMFIIGGQGISKRIKKDFETEIDKENVYGYFTVSKVEQITPSQSQCKPTNLKLETEQLVKTASLSDQLSEEILQEFNNSKNYSFSKLLCKSILPSPVFQQQQKHALSLKPKLKHRSHGLSFLKLHSSTSFEHSTPQKPSSPIALHPSTIRQQSQPSLSSISLSQSLTTFNQNPSLPHFTISSSLSHGGRYEGYLQHNSKHGYGKLFYDDGGIYDGDWKDDMMHGFGRLYYREGALAYQGEFFTGEFHGKGKVYNDEIEIEEIRKAMKQGFDWRNFEQLGEQWLSYEGYFRCDMRNGVGRLKLANEEVFEGEFRDDRIEGEGRFYTKDGELVMGVWNDSKFVG